MFSVYFGIFSRQRRTFRRSLEPDIHLFSKQNDKLIFTELIIF